MAQNIATLAVKFVADTTGLKAGSDKAGGILGSLSKSVTFAAVGTAAFAAASYAAYKAMEQFNASANRIDATSKLATRLDATYETMQKLQFVAGRSGAPIENVAKAMEHMARTVGSGGKSLDVAFAMQAKRISEIADPAKRTTEAYRVFGRVGSELLPLLKNIAADSERFARFNASFGFGVTDTDSQNVERMNDAWSDLIFIGTQLADKFVSKFGGPVADFLEEGIHLLEQWAAAFAASGVRWEDIGNVANNAMIVMTQMVRILNNELKTTFYLLGQLSRFSKLIGSVNPLAASLLAPTESTPLDFGSRGGFNGGPDFGLGETKLGFPSALEKGSAGAVSAVLNAGGNPLATVAENTKEMLESLRELLVVTTQAARGVAEKKEIILTPAT